MGESAYLEDLESMGASYSYARSTASEWQATRMEGAKMVCLFWKEDIMVELY